MADLGANALVGGVFKQKEAKSFQGQMLLLWGLCSGYFDLWSDIAGAYSFICLPAVDNICYVMYSHT